MMTEAKTILIVGSIVFLSVQLTVPGILMLGSRSYSNKQFMRTGKVNFYVVFRQSLFRVYAVRCKLCW